MIRAKAARLMLPLVNALNARIGTRIIAAQTARVGVPAFGVQQTTLTRSVLIFEAKIGNMQNVLTAMKHIRHGLNPAWPT